MANVFRCYTEKKTGFDVEAKALLKDYEEQKKAGKDPIFDPDKFNWHGTETWKGIRDKYLSGELK